ncbi:TetR/AcrR family transcriptional regulator C-terminal domain-containing protein [Nonomuraea dietziae]|uniref:TetR/AcrR family transcriptional regulator C-terminal domain-containing protein n=1 Tax=Nonomuraea dietziae TaxID=65515 RepID=UPI0033CFF0A4
MGGGLRGRIDKRQASLDAAFVVFARRGYSQACAADRLARLSSGRLRPCDPAVAAEQLLSLLTGPMEARSLIGTRKVSSAELRTVAEAAVDTFLPTYGTAT